MDGEGQGARFTATFQLSDTSHYTVGDIVKYESGSLVRLRYEFSTDTSGVKLIDEVYQLTSKGPQSFKLKHSIGFKNSGLPFWVQFLAVSGLIRKKMGPNPLDGIEELVS
tara:strand:+ start:5310 stop:5639 length:330 start_codon:yes stop_codon:yes gene_type:complete